LDDTAGAGRDESFLLSAEPLELGEPEILPVAEPPASLADDSWSFDLDEQPATAPEQHGRAEDELWSLDELQSDLEPSAAEPTAAELPLLDLPTQGFEEQPLELESLELEASDERGTRSTWTTCNCRKSSCPVCPRRRQSRSRRAKSRCPWPM